MLGKLIKHEFRATGRIMLPVMAAMVLLALLANLSIRGLAGGLSDIPVLRFMFILIVIFFVVAIIGTSVMAMVLMVGRFYRNLLKDEGYLMFTLPVSVHELICSKLIVSLVWFIAAALVTFLVISATGLNLANTNLEMILQDIPSWEEIREFLKETGVFGHLIQLFFQSVLMTLLGIAVVCLHFYAAMALGHMFSKDKVILSIVFYVAISFLFNLMNLGYGGVLGPQMENMFGSTAIETAPAVMTVISSVFWHLIIIEAIQSAVLYLATALGLKRGLNLG